MASGSVIAVLGLVLLVLQPLIASNPITDFLSPLLAPALEDVCKDVECGKGKCRASSNATFFFECECDPGWKQSTSFLELGFKFLPCVVPNCSLDYSCEKAPSPVQKTAGSRASDSIFDPCSWTDCRGGVCNKTSKFTYGCICSEGYYNLLNVTAFPCFRDCAIGMDCRKLGISMANKSTSPTPNSVENSNSHASSVLRENNRLLTSSFVFASIVFLPMYKIT